MWIMSSIRGLCSEWNDNPLKVKGRRSEMNSHAAVDCVLVSAEDSTDVYSHQITARVPDGKPIYMERPLGENEVISRYFSWLSIQYCDDLPCRFSMKRSFRVNIFQLIYWLHCWLFDLALHICFKCDGELSKFHAILKSSSHGSRRVKTLCKMMQWFNNIKCLNATAFKTSSWECQCVRKQNISSHFHPLTWFKEKNVFFKKINCPFSLQLDAVHIAHRYNGKYYKSNNYTVLTYS